jgi:hypothetical protein
VSLPGTEKTTRGFSKPALVIIDEASQIDDGLYSTGIRPMMLRSQGQIMLLSTPYGKRGIFYKVWTEGINWRKFRVPVTDVPSVDQDFIEEEKREKSPEDFAQEYLCEFIDTEDQVFATNLIEAALDNQYTPLFG